MHTMDWLFFSFSPISFFLDLSRELRPDWFNLLGVAVLYCIISGVGRKKGIGFPVRWESAGWGYSKPSHFDGLLRVITLLLWGAGANQSFVTYGSIVTLSTDLAIAIGSLVGKYHTSSSSICFLWKTMYSHKIKDKAAYGIKRKTTGSSNRLIVYQSLLIACLRQHVICIP